MNVYEKRRLNAERNAEFGWTIAYRLGFAVVVATHAIVLAAIIRHWELLRSIGDMLE